MEELKVLEKIYKMMHYGFQRLDSYPKLSRFTVVPRITKYMDEIMDNCIDAQKAPDREALLRCLKRMDASIVKLKYRLRLSVDLKYLSAGQYRDWNEKVIEIGKMLGGWIKAIENNEGTRQRLQRR